MPVNILKQPFEYKLKLKKPKYIKKLEKVQIQEVCTDIENDIIKIISHPNFKDKSDIFEQFDYTVGNKTIIEPSLCGGVSSVYIDENNILGVTIDSNPQKVYLSPKNGVESTFIEAYRKLVSQGFEPVGLTNCLNFANIENDDISYQFVKSVEGLANVSRKLNVPVVSGNVSMYNETNNKPIYPTVVLAMVGRADSYKSVIKNYFSNNETIFLLGKSIDEKMHIGGSFYQYVLFDKVVGKIDRVDYKKKLCSKISFLI
ncbi:MAG: AIR synthase related protein [Candidatus Melainabacteria bacterium]|nr:MAG: AIR synthase related protein [Candidatus Melainabacteria bacterium]